jgi:hypothetical protein
MSTEKATAAVLTLSERGRPRGADLVYAAARTSPPVLPSGIGTERRRHALLLRAALLVLVVGTAIAALVAMRVIPGRDLVTRVTDEILGSDRGPYDDQLDEWLDGYDPAERQYLEDSTPPDFGDVSKQYEVSTLEFRRTCRKLVAALAAANAPGVTDRSAAIYEIMGPQLARNDERERVNALADGSQPLGPGVGAMWEAWHTMTAQAAAGDETSARSFIEHNCTGGTLLPWVDE